MLGGYEIVDDPLGAQNAAPTADEDGEVLTRDPTEFTLAKIAHARPARGVRSRSRNKRFAPPIGGITQGYTSAFDELEAWSAAREGLSSPLRYVVTSSSRWRLAKGIGPDLAIRDDLPGSFRWLSLLPGVPQNTRHLNITELYVS